MAIIATLGVSVTAQTQKFTKGLKGARGAIGSFAAGASRAALSVKGFALALGAGLIGGGIGAAIKQSFGFADALAKTSAKLGIATEDLRALQLAGEQTGMSANQVSMGIQRMTRRIAEAAQGSGEARGALKELGLSATSLAQMAPDEQFRAIARAMENVGNQSDRVRLGFKLFDAEGVGLINTLALGEEGLEAIAERTRQFGTALTNVEANQIEQANDSVNLLREQFRGLFLQISVRLAPIIKGIAEAMTNFGLEGQSAGERVEKVFNILAGPVLETFLAAMFGVQAAWFGFKGVIEAVAGGLLIALGKISNAVVEVINAFTGAKMKGFGGEMIAVGEAFGEAAEKSFAKAGEKITKTFSSGTGDLIRTMLEEWAAESRRLAEEAGQKTKKDLENIAEPTKAAGATARTAFAQQVDLRRQNLRAFGQGQGQEQRVTDPQLRTTNKLLGQLVNRSGPVFA